MIDIVEATMKSSDTDKISEKMSYQHLSVSELLADPDAAFDKVNRQSCYDHFCFHDWVGNKAHLKRKAMLLLSPLRFLVDEGLINPDVVFVRFQTHHDRNAPVAKRKWDDLQLGILGTDVYLGGLSPNNRTQDKKASIWLIDKNKNPRFVEFKEKNWFKLRHKLAFDDDFRAIIIKHFMM